jgi:hypothetical protein
MAWNMMVRQHIIDKLTACLFSLFSFNTPMLLESMCHSSLCGMATTKACSKVCQHTLLSFLQSGTDIDMSKVNHVKKPTRQLP